MFKEFCCSDVRCVWFIIFFLFTSAFIHCWLTLTVYIPFLRKHTAIKKERNLHWAAFASFPRKLLCFFPTKQNITVCFLFFLSSDCHFFKTEGTATIPTDFCQASRNLRSLLVHHSQEFNAYRCSLRRTYRQQPR